ncbi:MAG TPA: DUF4287 domain-containing protein [Candidatus Saccharimonadales bacterium]|nr:DUF4287 domain-containing protein [Candidatus Saccharimonadales bacterium]
MTFQAYIDNIYTKTGKTPEQLKEVAEKAGVYSYDMKASDLVKFLKDEYDLGHGHSMAIWLVFKQKGWVKDPKKS